MQISDSHIGFAKPPNVDTPGTLREAVKLVSTLKGDAGLMIHTGDVSHLSRDSQFDTAQQIIGEAGLETHYVPGVHDVLVDDGRGFFERFTKGGANGWYRFDQAGMHFIGLNNVQNLKGGGMGSLGADQLAWLRDDPSSTRRWEPEPWLPGPDTSRHSRSSPFASAAPLRRTLR